MAVGIVAAAGDILKAHVHTATPDAVFNYAARWGTVASTKADDMRAQHRRLKHLTRRPVAVVTDSSADLPDALLDRHHLALVPLQVLCGDQVFQDRVGLADEVLAVLLGSALSGTFRVAQAAGLPEPGWRGQALVKEVTRIRMQSGLGAGELAVCWQVEDGTPTGPGEATG